MLNLKVGACYAKTYQKIADYFECELLDFRKADKVYRIGLDRLKPSETSDDNDASEQSFCYQRSSTSSFNRRTLKEHGNI